MGFIHSIFPFIHKKPLWRDQRYYFIIQSIQKIIKNEFSLEFIQKKLCYPENSFQTLIKKLYEETFFNLNLSRTTLYKNQYLKIINLIRLVTKTNEYQLLIIKNQFGVNLNNLNDFSFYFFHFFIEILYTRVGINEFSSSLLSQIVAIGKSYLPQAPNKQKRKSNGPLEELRLLQEAIKAAPSFIKISRFRRYLQALRGQLNLKYDSHLQENTPYLLYQCNNVDKKVSCLRLGTPTIENFFSSLKHQAKISPEFIAFLQLYRIQNKKHLYVNFQKRRRKIHGFTEAAKCRALESVGRLFPSNFFIITLAKNSAFYWQEGCFQESHNARTFKAQFKREMLQHNSDFYFCDSLRKSFHFETVIDTLLDFVHHTFFFNNEELRKSERLDFIEIFYAVLVEEILSKIDFDSYNLTCRDGIDRAGGGNALFYLYKVLKNYSEIDINQWNLLKVMLLTPAILVKKRAISQNRFERFFSSANRIYKHFEGEGSDASTSFAFS